MAKTIREQFGSDIREARLRAGLSQTQVGDLTGTPQTYVSDVEKGKKNLTLDSMAKLARAVGLEIIVVTRTPPLKK